MVVSADVDEGQNTVTTPSPASTSTFTATLLPANEVPPVAGNEAGGSGTATLTFNLTKDSAGYVTAATLDATVNPDFSQVESDAGQVTANQRFALFYAEKRPFFLEGIELFSTPNQLVYTRQIVSPIAGGKVTGKQGRLNVAFLSAKEKEAGFHDRVPIARTAATHAAARTTATAFALTFC